MVSVVFLRAVNVGGNTLKPKALADTLGLISIGAAGTFVGRNSATMLKREIALALPFQTEVFVCPGDEILSLVQSAPFGSRELEKDTKQFVTILEEPPRTPFKLPIEKPDNKPWEVRIVAVENRYVLSLRCRRHPRAIYPNAVVERAFGMPATTRGWDTLDKVCDVLKK